MIGTSRLFAGLAAVDVDVLADRTRLIVAKGGDKLFAAGEIARALYLVVDGAIQVTIGSWVAGAPDGVERGSVDAAADSALLLQILGPGDIVGDIEIIPLLTGRVLAVARQTSARVLTKAARLIAIDQHLFAQMLRDHPDVRDRVAGCVVDRLRRTQTLLAETAVMKTRGKVRLARLLLDLFDRFGTAGFLGVEFPATLSHEALGEALGLTRRSVFDDVNALEDFGAIDHDRSGRLTLVDADRLKRVASVDGGHDDEGAAWAGDIRKALIAGDCIRAREFASEALAYVPRSEEVRQLAVVAALRSGALETAKQWLAAFGFTAEHPSADIAALSPELLKEEALLEEDEGLARRLVARASAEYRAVYERTAGIHVGIDTASLLVMAGRLAEGQVIARRLLQQTSAANWDYRTLALRAEAHAILGLQREAARDLREAVTLPGADPGPRAATCRRLRHLACRLRQDWSLLLAVAAPQPMVMLSCRPPLGEAAAGQVGPCAAAVIDELRRRNPWRTYIGLSNRRDFALAEALVKAGIALIAVLPQPIDSLNRHASKSGGAIPDARLKALLASCRGHCVIGDGSAATASARSRQALRHGLGLAITQAQLREAGCILVDADEPTESRAVYASGRLVDPGDLPDVFDADALPDGLSAVVAVERLDAEWAGVQGLVEPISSRCQGAPALRVGRQALYAFDKISRAACFAFAARARLRSLSVNARLCCDVTVGRGDALATTRLCRLRPATAENEIFATEAFVAECALFAEPFVRAHYVGRTRSLERRGRLALWSLAPIGRLAMLERADLALAS